MATLKVLLLAMCVVFSALFPSHTFAQGSTRSSPMASPGPPQPTNPATYPNGAAGPGVAGDYLAGNVAVKGGMLPWEPVSIAVSCDGKTRYTAMADAKGNFTIGSSVQPVKDEKPFAAQFVGCEVKAALPGFQSSSLVVADRNVKSDPNLGTILLSRAEGPGGAADSTTTASAPKDAAKAYEKARTEVLEQKPEKALRDLQKAVQIDPQFAEAWYQLGRIQEAQNSPDAANSFSKAVEGDPKFVLPYGHLAVLAERSQKWDQLVDWTSRELALNPQGDPQVWYYNALGNFHLNKLDVAQASAEKSLAMDPMHTVPITEQVLAVILVNKQDYAGALQHLRNCLTYFKPGPNLELVKQQISQLESSNPAVK
jgi:Tfp pilus assembly protein PilF